MAQVRKQCAAVRRGDYAAAAMSGNRLDYTLPGMPALMAILSQSDPRRVRLNAIVGEMQELQTTARHILEEERGRVAQLLQEIKVGRQLLSRYRSGRKSKHKLFDISG